MTKKLSVVRYVESERAKGKKDKAITHDLLDAGWHMDIIHRALDSKKIPKATIQKTLTEKSTVPKEAWYILIIAASVVAMLLAAFA